jgi:HIV-1 Vpr-binding protein
MNFKIYFSLNLLANLLRIPFDYFRIILAAAEGEIVADPDCQRSALNVIINCVCGPLSRIGGSIARLCGGSAKKRSFRSGEDLLAKMWNCVRANNGIMILLNLLMVKTPITDADSIRALSCKALCGLARSETVKQIIGKLPLFTNGQLQGLYLYLFIDLIAYSLMIDHNFFSLIKA